MMASDFIIDVSDETFEFEVLNYSTQTPVVMDFWATWSIPSRVQSPLLAKFAHEAQGQFRLARVNVDDQPKLAERLNVRNLPSVKAFVGGRMVAEYTGVLNAEQLHSFISRLLPKQGDLLLEKGKSLLVLGDYSGAEDALKEFLSFNYHEPAGLIALARVMLIQGKGRDAQYLLAGFPASNEFNNAQTLKPLAKALVWSEEGGEPGGSALDASFNNALRIARRGNLYAALDGLLDIIKLDKHYRDGWAREIYLAILQVLGDENPEVRQYRADLTNALF
ncbi:MAG: tetratricopeptide repeat protein [Anaerolineaceae bacterium]